MTDQRPISNVERITAEYGVTHLGSTEPMFFRDGVSKAYPESQRCAAQHFGFWLIEPNWITEAVNAIEAGTWAAAGRRERAEDAPLFTLHPDGIAEIQITDQMTKGDSSFGGTSTLRTRRAIRTAAAESAVKGIMMVIDSPGGTVAGTEELGDVVRQAAAQKPVHAHADDLMASAAMWVGAQAGFVTANRTADVGSLGVVSRLLDTSGAMEARGVKVHTIRTAPMKAPAAGPEITEDQLAFVQQRVNEMGEEFAAAIKRGRGMKIADARDLVFGDDGGKLFKAETAKRLGLVDELMGVDAAFGELRKVIRRRDRETEQKTEALRRKMRRVAS